MKFKTSVCFILIFSITHHLLLASTFDIPSSIAEFVEAIDFKNGYIKLFHNFFENNPLYDYFMGTVSCYIDNHQCCSETGIPANFDDLEDILQKRLYGQHLVQDIVVNAIRSHWSNNSKPQKTLALSLRGTPGSGKTYVTNFIKENLYASGHKSNFVNHFNARNDFASKKNIDKYEEDIHMKIERKVTQCPKQLFIFDESDLIPPQLLDKLKFMIDYNVDYTQSIFIFLSHIGGELINDHYFYLLKEANKTREDLKLADFYTLISKEAFFKEDYDFYNSLVKTFLIDHYVPFLPMERRHVRQCIVDEFLRRNIMNPKEEYINKILEIVQWVPLNEKVFSRSGCKQISQQVGTTVSQYKLQ